MARETISSLPNRSQHFKKNTFAAISFLELIPFGGRGSGWPGKKTRSHEKFLLFEKLNVYSNILKKSIQQNMRTLISRVDGLADPKILNV